MKSVVYNDVWYVCGGEGQGREVYSAPLQSIVESTRDTRSTVWTKLPPTPHEWSSIALFGQQLLTIGGDYPPRGWLSPHIGEEEAILCSACLLPSLPVLATCGGLTFYSYIHLFPHPPQRRTHDTGKGHRHRVLL